MGNLIPGLLSFPLGGTGLLLWRPDDPFRPLPLALLIAFPILGWFSLAFFGLWSNSAMRSELAQRFGRDRGPASGSMLFVGVASPSFRSLIDPHEDIALLILSKDDLEIYGEKNRFRVKRTDVLKLSLKPNTHSWVALGGWIVFQCREITFFIESRQNDALIVNALQRKRLLSQLEHWRVTGEVAASPGP